MKAVLKRVESNKDGIFGNLIINSIQLYTLEHAYLERDGKYYPKLTIGNYTCKRGIHKLHNNIPFETFEIMNVPGHKGILLHVGNYNKDSEGCVLLGMNKQNAMITNSMEAFTKFMDQVKDLESFDLEVTD